MAHIGLLGFLHETNTFAPGVTTLAQFVEADAWPGLITGDEILRATQGMNLAFSGFVSAMQGHGHTLVPLLWCSANPSAAVEDAAFEAVVEQILTLIDQAPPLDALFLDLHGAMVTVSYEDAEGELLTRLRTRLGAALPMVAALDFHANVSTAMLRQANGLVAYRSYPHVDIAQTGERAAQMLLRLLAAEPLYYAARQVDILIPMPWQSTLAEPARSIMSVARALEGPDTPEVQFIPGFPLADIHDSGPTILAYGRTQAQADQAADLLCARVQASRQAFRGQLLSIAEAIAFIQAHPEQRILLADTQDNPGGGGTGDTTDLLHALAQQAMHGVCAGIVCDPAFAQAAHQAGTGHRLHGALGGHSGMGAGPLIGEFHVLATGDGHFTGTGPFYLGCHMALGRMARVRYGTIEILVSSKKQQAADQAMFRHLGAEPTQYRVLVLKSSVHFRADFAALADKILVVAAPGENTADLHALTYRRLRPGVTIL
ncbi:M81 family metallopeptidase [Alcaligenaceae bacterium CGII-47]|nr:M81 family metallopeptidase [Alcaligenaceae bacterium CGII-47]